MDLKAIREKIKAAKIDTLRVEFPDMFGISRGKFVPAGRLDEVVKEGINCAKPTFSLDLNYNIPEGTGTAEEVNYEDMTIIPDLDTFTVVPYQEGVARFIGDIYADGKPFPYSPRGLLKNVVKKYKARGLTPITATELEFFLFKPNGDALDYYCDKPSNVYTANPRSDAIGLLRTIQNTLIDMGIDVLYSNHEFFQGQYEINWKHDEAMKVADQSFTFKAVCKEVAHMNDLLLTFMGRPKDEMGGSGYHLHLSINDRDSGKNLFDDPNGKDGISDMMRHFIGGQLAHARAMTLLFMPTINSYKRTVIGNFAPYYIAWGLDNRSTYIRVPGDRGQGTRVENRAPCATANPYLAAAAALLAGLDGIEKKTDPGDYYEGDIYGADPGDFDTVPFYMQDAIEAFKKDEVLCEAIGPEIVQNILAIRENEVERFRTAVTEWEFNEYAYHL
ncbi:MAG: glutamine synthetase [Deltaproteobacteria bacterium]|nr:MAG: glutamine synthetase [Deltaproteobacteria bacterium]